MFRYLEADLLPEFVKKVFLISYKKITKNRQLFSCQVCQKFNANMAEKFFELLC